MASCNPPRSAFAPTDSHWLSPHRSGFLESLAAQGYWAEPPSCLMRRSMEGTARRRTRTKTTMPKPRSRHPRASAVNGIGNPTLEKKKGRTTPATRAGTTRAAWLGPVSTPASRRSGGTRPAHAPKAACPICPDLMNPVQPTTPSPDRWSGGMDLPHRYPIRTTPPTRPPLLQTYLFSSSVWDACCSI